MMDRTSLTLFINNGWYLQALSGGDLHVMEVAARWAQVRDVGIAMPGWAYRLHAQRLHGVRLFDTGRFDGTPPWPFAGVCVRWALRTMTVPDVRPTLVVAASQYPYDLIPALAVARRSDCPLMVYVFHLPSVLRRVGDGGRLVSLWEPLAIRLLRRATVVLVDNADVRHELTRRGVAAQRIHPTWNATMAPPLGTDERRRPDEVVYCGRITDSKGWKDLLAVGERLRRECPGSVLRILGDGDRRRHLERAIADHHLEQVIRTEGFVDDEAKWRALRRAAAFISPSREEGWGIAVAEAVDAGAEVVCYDLPVYQEVHRGQRLHLAPVGDVDALGQRLIAVLRGQYESSAEIRRDRLAGAGLRTWNEIAGEELRLAQGLSGGDPSATDEIRAVAR
jgi:glycosyltransferase involved in cell wall biosynthesis